VYEAKVDDWKRGLHQANTYATWADAATLAVGRLPKDRGPALGLAAALNVGLVERDIWRHRAHRQQLPATTRLWASEHVLQSLLYHQPSAAA
jgi:hypothetical protein